MAMSEINAKVINEFLQENFFTGEDRFLSRFHRVINYSLIDGGKRIRPLLFLETRKMFGEINRNDMLIASAIEMIHTYSLIHDDLPAMDNDNFRRGKLTSHKKFTEAEAILAGDALLNEAVNILLGIIIMNPERPEYARAAGLIMESAGIDGMIGGQVIDMTSEGKKINEETLDYIIENKTLKLLKAAVLSAGMVSNATDEEILSLDKVASNIGYSFQVVDDLLDVTGKVETLGKKPGQDEKHGKNTYVSYHGKEKAREMVQMLASESLAKLDLLSASHDVSYLSNMVTYLRDREK